MSSKRSDYESVAQCIAHTLPQDLLLGQAVIVHYKDHADFTAWVDSIRQVDGAPDEVTFETEWLSLAVAREKGLKLTLPDGWTDETSCAMIIAYDKEGSESKMSVKFACMLRPKTDKPAGTNESIEVDSNNNK